MRARLFIEIELDDAVLLSSLSNSLPPEHWDRELASGLARQTERFLGGLHSVKEVKAVYIPKLLSTI